MRRARRSAGGPAQLGGCARRSAVRERVVVRRVLRRIGAAHRDSKAAAR